MSVLKSFRNFLCAVFVVFFIISFFYPTYTYAIVINEIYPSASDTETEWVELYNDEDYDISTEQYTLEDETGKNLTFDQTSIQKGQYATASSVKILNNSGDTLYLKDQQGNIVLQITYPDGIQTTYSYARCPDKTGEFIKVSSTTKKSENDTSCAIITPTSNPTELVSQTTPSPIQTSWDKIYIWEIYPYPNEGEKEWVELYNENDFSVQLNKWFIDDVLDSGSSPFEFTLTIGPKNYSVIEIPSQIFNNDGDTVRLLDYKRTQKDIQSYADIQKGKSFARVHLSDNTFCMQDPTRASSNLQCIQSQTEEESQTIQEDVQSVLGENIQSTPTLKTQTAEKDNEKYIYVNYINDKETRALTPSPKKSLKASLLNTSFSNTGNDQVGKIAANIFASVMIFSILNITLIFIKISKTIKI